MKNQDTFEVQGEVLEALPNTMFRVQLDQDAPEELKSKIILGTLSGKMRMYRIKVMPGDKVKCEISRYDMTKGRITFRAK